jgi:hypothetical protein
MINRKGCLLCLFVNCDGDGLLMMGGRAHTSGGGEKRACARARAQTNTQLPSQTMLQ